MTRWTGRTRLLSQVIGVIGLGRQDDGFRLERADDRRHRASVENLLAERGDIVGGEGCGPIEPQPLAECRDSLLGHARHEQGQDFIRHMIRHVAPLFGVPHRDLGAMDDPSASRRAILAALIKATGSADDPAGSARGRRPSGGFRAGGEQASQSNRSQRKRPARGRFDRR